MYKLYLNINFDGKEVGVYRNKTNPSSYLELMFISTTVEQASVLTFEELLLAQIKYGNKYPLRAEPLSDSDDVELPKLKMVA